MTKKKISEIIVYQASNGAIELKGDTEQETLWANKKQIAEIFGTDRSVVSRHIKNIFQDKELDEKVVRAYFAHTTQHGSIEGKTQTRTLDFYNLDIILAVGYRTHSSRAIEFRKWATSILKSHITKGFTINPTQIEKNYQKFLQAVEEVKLLAKGKENISSENIVELVKAFAGTWFSLDAFDKSNFPKKRMTKKSVSVETEALQKDIAVFKKELMKKGEATELFAQEKQKGNLEGILGSVFQSVFGKDAYPTPEEKAAHLLYFLVKNHPFDDGNKRTGAFAFVWFLQKANIAFRHKITPEALTAITLLIATSDPKEKEKMTAWNNGEYAVIFFF